MSQIQASRVARILGVELPIIQGPFGGGLSTTRLAAAVSEFGGLGSYGAHNLLPEEIGRVADELRALTSRPFALNLWVSDHDPGGQAIDELEFERVTRLFEPWYRELGIELPAMPARYGQNYDEQVDALLESRPPVFSFVFGVPSRTVLAECRRRGICNRWTQEMSARTADLPPFPIQSWFAGRMRDAAGTAHRTDVVALWSGQIAPNLRHRTAETVFDELVNGIAPGDANEGSVTRTDGGST